jgi:chromosome segregation ATPase
MTDIVVDRLRAARDELREEVERLKNTDGAYLDEVAENKRLNEELEQANNYGRYCAQQYDALVERVSELEGALEEITRECDALNKGPVAVNIAREALEKIKFRNHPGTTNHELAKEALSRTSEELPARDREVGRRDSWTRAPK